MNRSSNDPEARTAREETAQALGRLAAGIDGAVSRSDELAARERFVSALGRSGRRSRVPGRLLLAAVVCAVAAGLVVWLNPGSKALDYDVAGPVVAEGEWLGVPADRSAVALRFSEGTVIELGPGSKGRVAAVSPEGAQVVLGSGALHARVVHRPRTRWIVAAGPYSIEVTGTAFDVGWSAAGERLEVSLHDGSVVVRGPSLQHGIRVAAGQRLVANARTGGAELSSLFEPDEAIEKVEPPVPAPPSPSTEPPARAPSPPPAASAPTWSELVSGGNFRAVIDAARARGVEQSLSHGSLRDLVALSDAARYSGDRALAKRGLLSQRARFASAPEARSAAFVLGRMADDAGAASEALEWYDRYLREAPRGTFAAEAMGRKLAVLVRLGNKGAAREVAELYLKRFPRGAHAAYARDVLRGL